MLGEAVRSPLERIPCGRPVPREQLGDPIIHLSTMARNWARWDAGDFVRHDDRVLAPCPDVGSLGDQFLLPAGALLLRSRGRTPRRPRGARRAARSLVPWLPLAGVVPLLALDFWTRPVPAQPVAPPSPFDAEIRSLPRDAIVAVWPFERGTSERSWAEQLSYRRRVLNGFQTFPPPIHLWLDSFLSDKPFEAAFAADSKLGVSPIEIDLAAAAPGSGERVEVVVETRSGNVRDVLRIPVVGAGEVTARLSRSLPPGSVVRAVDDGREVGRAVPPPPRPSSG